MRRSRLVIGLLLVAALLATSYTRNLAYQRRLKAVSTVTGGAASGSSLSNMNSYALAMMLGGLRGPLVMYLWTSSEAEKNENKLEDFDTKVEWIRLLQPEFVSVHLFQIWNKAYNVSVKMASLSNKYAAILDALEYARRVDRQRPDDINVVAAIGGIYGDKLGSSQEKVYYINRIRHETCWRKVDEKVRNDAGWRQREHLPMLDENGILLDSAGMKYLEPFQPFPQGLSPIAISYNYFKRAQILYREQHQKLAQLTDMVLDAKPSLAMEFWSLEEMNRARRLEIQAMGMPEPTQWDDVSLPTANIRMDRQVAQASTLQEAIYAYDTAAKVSVQAQKEFQFHLKNYVERQWVCRPHLAEMQALSAMALADRDYLQAMLRPQTRGELLKSARENYQEARTDYQRLLLEFYFVDGVIEAILPKGYTKLNLHKSPSDPTYIPSQDYAKYLDKAMRYVEVHPGSEDFAEERMKHKRIIDRAETRLKLIEE